MARPVSRNNVVAGLFVLGAALLAVAISVAVSGVQKRLVPTNRYTIQFKLTDGAQGLKVDSPVHLGGQEVGRVVNIRFVPEGGKPTGIAVDVLIDRRFTLHQDAWASLEKPLLGSMSAINISRVGGEPDKEHPEKPLAPVLAEGGTLNGTIAPPAFLAQAGFGPDQVKQVQQIFADVEDAVKRLNKMTQNVDGQLDPTFKQIRQALDDLDAITADAKKKWTETWSGQVDSVLTKTDKAADTLNKTLDDADQLVLSARKVIDDNSPTLDRSLANIDQAMKRLNEEAVGKLSDALDTGKAGAQAFKDLSIETQQLIRSETPNIQRILANLRLAAEQIKLMGTELRRNPWRVLYTPKVKELESELLYDSARTYAEAVSDLRAATEALHALTSGDGPAAGVVDRESLLHVEQRLQEAFGRYKEAEQDLLKRMGERKERASQIERTTGEAGGPAQGVP